MVPGEREPIGNEGPTVNIECPKCHVAQSVTFSQTALRYDPITSEAIYCSNIICSIPLLIVHNASTDRTVAVLEGIRRRRII